MKKISLVIPCFNEEEALYHFYAEISKVALEMTEVGFEFIFVDDGSKDDTLTILRGLQEQDRRLSYLSFSRNFGKEAAIYAGLKNAHGDYIAIIDADLQDPPHLIKEMYQIILEQGYDCVATRRINRSGEPFLRSFCAKQFYRLINRISDIELLDGARDFRLMTRQMVDSVLQICEYNRFSKGIFAWVGFKTKWLEFDNQERIAGQTKWSFWKLYTYSLEGIMAFSTVPLAIASVAGMIFILLALLLGAVLMSQQFIFGGAISGWYWLLSILLLMTGIQLFCTGIVGQYVSRTYLETKHRPIYIIKELSGLTGE